MPSTSGLCKKSFRRTEAMTEPGYVFTRAGTLGRVIRRYRTLSGVPMVVLRWGPLDWISPIPEADTYRCRSRYESEAAREGQRHFVLDNRRNEGEKG